MKHDEDCGLQVRVLSCWMVLLLPRSCCWITAYEYLFDPPRLLNCACRGFLQRMSAAFSYH